MNVKAGDRLSSLPDDLIHNVLYFLDIKHAIRTSVLSSRWRYTWTLMRYLNFSSEGFSSGPQFSSFVNQVLSRRNNEINVSSVKLRFSKKYREVLLDKRFLEYAFSHNLQQMTLTNLFDKKIVFPFYLFSSHSLKHLTLIGFTIYHSITPSSTWELLALTTLHLEHVTLYDHAGDKFSGFFSKCTNLKILTIIICEMIADGLSICNPQLFNLTLEDAYFVTNAKRLIVVNVVAPQLKNLSLVHHHFFHPLFASRRHKHRYVSFIFGCLFSLEKVDLCIRSPCEADAPTIVNLLQQFHSVKFLTLNLELIEALSSSVELLSNQPSLFAHLKKLKVYPDCMHSAGQAQKNLNVSYLLNSSPNATFTIVSREEMRARWQKIYRRIMGAERSGESKDQQGSYGSPENTDEKPQGKDV